MPSHCPLTLNPADSCADEQWLKVPTPRLLPDCDGTTHSTNHFERIPSYHPASGLASFVIILVLAFFVASLAASNDYLHRYWDIEYDKFSLHKPGVTHCISDTRLFKWRNPDDDDEFLFACIHVDNHLTFTSTQVHKVLVDAWCLDFDEEIDDFATLSEDIASVRDQRVDSSPCVLTCVGVTDYLGAILAAHQHNCIETGVPLFSVHLRISRCVNERRLTVYAWRGMRRMAAYLNGTRHLGLTLRSSNGQLSAYVDSSLANRPEANAVTLVKTAGKENSSDIYTKPLTGALSGTHRATELGLQARARGHNTNT